MGYDEKIFKAKANIKARRLWLVFAILLTANYGTDTANGAYSVSNYIIFCYFYAGCLFVCGDILLKKEGGRIMIITGLHLSSDMVFFTYFFCVRQPHRLHSPTFFR